MGGFWNDEGRVEKMWEDFGTARVVWGEKQEDSSVLVGFFTTAKHRLTDFHFGWYTAKLNATWGESAQKASASYSFFIFPWQLLLIVSTVILVIWLVFKIWLNRFKRQILAQAIQQK